MAILRCNSCAYLREIANEHIGKSVKCPVCQQTAVIHDSVAFIKKLIEKYGVLLTKYRSLELPASQESEAAPSINHPGKIEDLDLHNTAVMGDSKQYQPIVTWFERKNVQVEVNHEALDTQGFYDEIAVELGDNIDVLQEVLDKIRKTQRNNYTSVTLNLSNYSQNQIKTMTAFCKNLYDFSFVAKYFYDKNEKRARLTLQTAPAIVNFFNGEWLEWYVFMKLLKHCYEQNGLFSCLRNFNIQFANEDKYEVDVFFLLNSRIPVFIECKSGEFRSYIEKYNRMRRRLDIDKDNFLLLVFGISDEQVLGLTKMYGITFVNEKTFIPHVVSLMPK